LHRETGSGIVAPFSSREVELRDVDSVSHPGVWAHDAQAHNDRLTWSGADFGRLHAYELRNAGMRRAHKRVDWRLSAPSGACASILRCPGPTGAASNPPPGLRWRCGAWPGALGYSTGSRQPQQRRPGLADLPHWTKGGGDDELAGTPSRQVGLLEPRHDDSGPVPVSAIATSSGSRPRSPPDRPERKLTRVSGSQPVCGALPESNRRPRPPVND
jgi:hypothetical protein